jgi:hypothetical protein
MMDEITWQKAFNAGRAYQVIARLNVELMHMQHEYADFHALNEPLADLRTLANDAMFILNGDEW